MTEDRLAEALTRHLEAGEPLPELGAPYDDLLAGLVSGTLLDDEREGAIELLAKHPELRRRLAGVASAAEAETPLRRGVRWPQVAAVAAVVLVLLGAALFAGRGPRSERDQDQDQEARLVAATETLRKSHPDLFADFEPLGTSERAERAADVQRGGLVLVAPRGAILEGRPTLRWRGLPGATAFDVSVIDEEGHVILSETTAATELGWPASATDVPPGGELVWKVEVDAPGRRLTGVQAFRRPRLLAAQRYRLGLTAIRSNVRPAEEADLLAAWWAIRNDLLLEAKRLLEGAGESDVAEETRAWLRDALRR